jgi:hypothetical protein
VGLHVSRLLFLFTPSSGLENFFGEIGQPAQAGVAPLPLTDEQKRQIVELAPKHGLQLAL